MEFRGRQHNKHARNATAVGVTVPTTVASLVLIPLTRIWAKALLSAKGILEKGFFGS